jgi:O-methyltransferase
MSSRLLIGLALAAAITRLRKDRHAGRWRDKLPEAFSMIGRERLDHLAKAVETILAEKIPGDLMECGVWRGGACILMAGMLAERNITDRNLWLADSFAGFATSMSLAPTNEKGDLWDQFMDAHPNLAVSRDALQANLSRFDLMGPQIRFLEGWFSKTLPVAPVKQLALLRLDADTFSATTDALENLYDKLSMSGFIIVDDYAIPECRAAVKAFREGHGISDPIQRIDWTGVFWRKGSEK